MTATAAEIVKRQVFIRGANRPFGDLTLEESMHSVDLFSTRVQPALEEVPA